jgi:dTDP-glucose 4,6-dehydratase
MNKILITGGCGFVGHHFVEHFLKKTDWDIIIFDKLTYASNGFDRLRDIDCFDNSRIKIFPIDLAYHFSYGVSQEVGEVDYIINLASESHVDNSIENPVPFIQNNINLVLNLLEWCRGLKNLKKFIQFSTDEVYGTALEGINYKEGDRFNPGNPYSASKAAQESICRAYSNTYGLPIIITNTMNVIGERQHPEKFVPLVIRKVLNSEIVTIHADHTKTKAGTRFYIHARNVADAVHFLINETERLDNIDAGKGQYNIVGEVEIDNLTLAQKIADIIGKELKYEMVDFHSSRPGHDLRYALDGFKMKNLGWITPKRFDETLESVVNWTLNRKEWS